MKDGPLGDLAGGVEYEELAVLESTDDQVVLVARVVAH